MNQYNVLQAIFLSFYSSKLYREVAHRWGGKAFLYLLILLALVWIPFTYQIQHSLNVAYNKNNKQIISQIPIITIKNGILSTPENRPYFIKDPHSQAIIAIIDTTGKYQRLEQTNATMLATKTEIISHSGSNEVRTNQLPPKMNMTINPEIVNAYLKQFLGFMWIFFFLLFWIVAYTYRIIQALLYSAIGKLLAVVNHIPLSYGQIMQITMVAITPTILLATIFDFFAISFPFQNLFYFILAMIYLVYGLIANKS